MIAGERNGKNLYADLSLPDTDQQATFHLLCLGEHMHGSNLSQTRHQGCPLLVHSHLENIIPLKIVPLRLLGTKHLLLLFQYISQSFIKLFILENEILMIRAQTLFMKHVNGTPHALCLDKTQSGLVDTML